MSMNMQLGDFPLKQTTSSFTWTWYGKPRLVIAKAYKLAYIDPYRPPVLRGKDSRNPHVIAGYESEMRACDEEYERLLGYLKANPDVQWSYR